MNYNYINKNLRNNNKKSKNKLFRMKMKIENLPWNAVKMEKI